MNPALVSLLVVYALHSCQLLTATTSAPASQATGENRILGYRVVNESPSSLVLDLQYEYLEEPGRTAWVNVHVAADGRALRGISCQPGGLSPGPGVSRLTLTAKRGLAPLEANQLQLVMFTDKGRRLFARTVPYSKTWSGLSPSRVAATAPSRLPDFIPLTRVEPEPAARAPVAAKAKRSEPRSPSTLKAAGVADARPATSAPAARPPTPRAYKRWAIVASPEIEKRGLADALTVALSQQSNVQLVERTQIEAATKELLLSQMVGPAAAGGRLKLGHILKADALILLAEESVGKDKDKREMIRVVISETSCGARLRLDSLSFPINHPDKLSDPIANLVQQTQEQYPSGLRWVIAVPPFVSQNISHEYDPLRARFAHVLEGALATYPGTAVLEMEEAQAIRKELALAGGDVSGRVVPVFVEGEFQIERAKDAEAVNLKVGITRPGGSQGLHWSLSSIEKAVEVLNRELPPQIMQIPAKEFEQALSVERQVELLGARADVFARRGEFLPSTALREAALLVDPMDQHQNESLFYECMTLVPYGDMVNWGSIPSDVLLANFQQRIAIWRRGVEVFEHMVRNRLIKGMLATELAGQIGKAFDGLIFFPRGSFGPKEAGYDPSAGKQFVKGYDECAEVYRRLVIEVVPVMAGLDPPPRDPTKPVGSFVINLALDLSRGRPWFKELAKSDLDHWAHVLIDLVPDQPIQSGFIFNMLEKVSTNPDYPREFSNAEYLQFLNRLGESNQQMNRLYNKLGYLLYDYHYGRNGQKASGEETWQAFEAVEREMAEYCRIKPGEASYLRSIREALMPFGRGHGPLPPLPPRVVTVEPNVKNEVGLERVPVVIRRKSGQSMALSKDSGWDSVGEAPLGVIAGETLDVFWNRRVIWVQHEPGVLREIFFSEDESDWFHDVAWDGQHIWAATASKGIQVYAPDGRLVARAGQAEGLPPAEVAAKLAPLSPGRVVAIGSLGARNRAWCANLTLQQGTVKVAVFHQATLARDRAEQERIKENDPRVTFVPYWVYNVPTSQPGSGPRLLLSCGSETSILELMGTSEKYVFWLFPDQGKVEATDFELAGNDNLATRHIYHFLANGDCLFAYGPTIRIWTAPSNRGTGTPAVRELYKSDRNEFYGQMFAYDGFVYAPGRQWVRVDARSLTVEPLGLGKGNDIYAASEMRFGLSKHLGLFGWTSAGMFTKVTVHPVPRASGANDQGLLAQFDREIAAHPGQAMPWQKKVSYLFTADRLEEAKSVCLSWIEACPRSIEARHALIDIVRKDRSGLDRFDTDEAWSSYPHPTLASWRIFNDPEGGGREGDMVVKAVRLPFAADATEWYIAELAALNAVETELRPPESRFRQCIEACDIWEAASRTHQGWCDASYLAYRAASRLGLGQFEAALVDAQAAVKMEDAGRLWAGNARELLKAVKSRNRDYKYQGDESRFHQGWLLKGD